MDFHDFEYELTTAPTAETMSVAFAPNFWFLSRELWPDVEIGAHLGTDEALKRNVRLCCVRLTMLSAKSRDEDTTERAVQSGVTWCVREDVALRFTQPVPPLQPAWLTSDVVALARGMRAAGHSAGVPVLTDALLEAGCDDPLVIEHLRTCTDHGPCCWVADMVCAQADGR